MENEVMSEEEENEVLSYAKEDEQKPVNIPHLTAKDLTQRLKLENVKNYDTANLKLQNIGETNFPRNTPAYIVGAKGSGKTYLLSAVFQYAMTIKAYRRIFYIYAENVDTTLTRAIPRNNIYQVPANLANAFIIKYLNKKTKYCSCYRLRQSLPDHLPDTVEQLQHLPIYWDNYLNDLVKNKKLDATVKLLSYVDKTIAKYGDKNLIMNVKDQKYNLDKFTINDFDAFIIDDIAQFPELFAINRRTSTLYKFFTITRQNMTTFYMAGQEIQQLPKLYRSQLGALAILKGIDITTALKESRLSTNDQITILTKWQTLHEHEGVLINFNNNTTEFIRC